MDIRTSFFQNIATALIGVMFLNPIVSVAADLAVDRAAGGNTSLHQAGNGVPLVNIATPNAGGLSHNRFTDYSVGAQGLILNNATDRTQATQLGGIIVGNPNLQGRAAGTILNEVTGTSRSQLKGYTEVAGHSARVIVANPHGITCDGCGFINTPRATLSTGRPMLEGGRLDRFEVDGGDIAIVGAGLNAGNVDKFELITRSARLNAELHARNLTIVAGRNDVQADSLAATPRAADGSAKPELAIDSSALGGMYAGAIRLVGTEAGVGVKLAGDMAASAGDIRIDANGKLTLAQVAAKGDLKIEAQSAELSSKTYAGGSANITAREDLVNRKGLAARDGVRLSSGGQLSNQGVIEAGINPDSSRNAAGDLQVQARELRNSGSLVAGRNLELSAGQTLDNRGGTLSAQDQAKVTAAKLDNQGGRVLAKGDLALTANELQNGQAGLVSSAGKLEAKLGHLDNRGGELSSQTRADLQVASVDNRSGTIIGEQALRLDASAAVDNQGGSLRAGRQLQLKAGALDNRGGQLTSGATLDLRAGALDNRDAGRIASAGKLSASVTALDQRNSGRLYSNSDLSLDLGGGHLNNSGGLLNAPGHLLLTNLGDVSNRGGEISSRQAFTLAARDLDNSDGKLLSAQALSVRVDQVLNNLKGLISASTLEARSASLNNAGGLVTSTGDLLLDVVGHAGNHGGEISSGGATLLSASSLDNRSGDLLGDSGLALSLKGALDNQGGTLGSQRDLDLQAASLDNRRGTLVADGALNARVSELLDNQSEGNLLAKGNLAIRAGRLDNRGGAISGQDRVRLDGYHLDNRTGKLAANGPLVLELSQLDNGRQGRITSQGSLDYRGQQLANQGGQISASGPLSLAVEQVHNAHGRIASQGDLSAVLGSLAQQGGELVTQGNLRLQALALDNRKGGLVGSTKALELEIGNLDNRGGELSSQSSVKLAGQWLDNSGGKLLAGTGLRLTVERVINQAKGLVFGRQAVILSGSSLDNSDGTLGSAGALAIFLAPRAGGAEGDLLNRHGLISSDGTLKLQAGRIDNQRGALSSAGDLSLVSTGQLSNQGGSIVTDAALDLASASLDNSAAGTLSAKGDARVATGALNNRQGGRLTAIGALELNADQVDNRDQGRIASGQRLMARVTGLDQQGGGELFSRSDLSLDLRYALLDNSDGGLINSPGQLLLRNLGQVINRGGEVSSQRGFTLVAQQLDNGGGQLLSNQTLVLRIAQALDNARGTITARRLDLSAGNLDNRAGEITVRDNLRADLGTLDQRGGLLFAGENLELKAGQLDNSAKGLISAGADLLLAVDEVDNRDGEISGQGVVRVSGSQLDNSDSGRLLAGGSLVLAIEHLINRAKGLISGNAGVALAGTSLDNSAGRLLSLQTVDIVLRDALSNNEGLINSEGRLDLTIGTLDNSGGSLSSAGAMAIDSRGAVANDKGQLLSDDGLQLSSTSLSNHQGVLSAKGKVQIASGRLDNSQGQLSSAETLDLTTAELINNAGTIGSRKALNASVSRLEQQGGQLFSDTDLRLDLRGGDLDNRRGLINAPGQLLLNNLGHLDNQGGEISSQQAFTLAARSLDNASGKLLSAQALTLRIEQALANLKGLIAGSRLDVRATSLANSGGTLTSRGDTRVDTAGALVNDDQGLINAAQRLTLNAGALGNRGGSLLAGTALALQAQGIDNREQGLINSQGTLDLQAGTLDSSNDGEVSARESMVLALDRLIQRQGRLISAAGLHLDLNGGDLDNQGGLILTQGPLHVSRLRDLANQAGEISSSHGFNLALRNLDNRGGKLISSGRLVLAGTGLNNQGGLLSGWQGLGISARSLDNRNLGTLSSRRGDLAVNLTGELLNSAEGALASQGRLDVKAGSLDNSGKGILSSGGDQQLDITDGLNNSAGGQIDSGAALDLKAASLSNAGGALHAQQLMDLRATELDNGGGSIAGNGAINLSLLGSFANTNGKLASAGPLLLQGATRIANQGGQIASQGLLTLLTGGLDNRNRGTLAANGALLLTSSGVVQNDNDGLIYSRDASIRIKAASLGNSLGAIQSQGDLAIDAGTFSNLGGRTLSQAGNLDISAGNLDNRGGTLASVQGWVKARLGGWLDNSANGGKAGLIQGGSLELDATAFLNQGGHISALGGDALLASNGNLDNNQGGLYAQGLLKFTGSNLSNAGQIAAQRIDFSLAGALDNQRGIIESDSILTIAAASLDNRGGQLRSLGATGRSQLSVQGLLDNRDGTLETANTDFGLTAGSFQNAGGTLLHIGSGAFDIALANVANAGGSIVTRGGLTLSADSWINSSIIQAGRLTVNVGQFQQTASGQLLASNSFTGSGSDWNNDGLIASDGSLGITLGGAYDGGGSLTSLGDLSLSARYLTLAEAGHITGGGHTRIEAANTLENRGRMSSAAGLSLSARALNNYGTLGSAEQLSLSAVSLANQNGLIFSGRDMVLWVDNFTNRFADVYSLGRLDIAADDAGRRSVLLENISATIESAGDMRLAGQSILNRKDSFSVSERLLSGSITYQCLNCKNRHFDLLYFVNEEIERVVTADSPASTISSGGHFTADTELFQNRHSTISAAGDIAIKTGTFLNEGAATERVTRSRIFRNPIDSEPRAVFYSLVRKSGAVAQYNQYNSHNLHRYIKRSERDHLDSYYSPQQQITAFGNPDFNPAAGYDVPAQILAYTLQSSSETATSSGVAANAIVQAGGKVSITATSELGNGVSRGSVAYERGVERLGNTSVASGVSDSVVRINSQLPPELAQKQLNPLTLPGFSIPTGPNGLFRLSGTAASDADATRADQGPQSWKMAGGSIDLAQRERDLSDTQARQAQVDQRGPAGTEQLDAVSRLAVDGANAGPIRVEADVAPPGDLTPERNDVSGSPAQGGAIAGTPGDTSDPQNQVVDRVQGLPANDAQSKPHRYLIETNPALTNLKQFLSSDYLLGLLGYDPDQAQKRLGDGLYEQRLVREAITARTGQRFIAGLSSDEAIFRYLMDNAIASKEPLGLSLGVSLSAAQVAALTHDIVWFEEHEVSGEKVLVPVLYLAHADGRLAPNGALIQGQDVTLISGGDLSNQGTLRAGHNLAVTAGDVANSGLMEAGNRLDLLATDSIRNAQGGIIAGRDVSAIALKGDIINERSQANLTTQSGTSARQDTVMNSAARIEAANNLSLSAGRDLANIGSVISAGGGANLSAGRDLLIGSATEVDIAQGQGKKSRWSEATITQHGSDLQVGGQLKAEAGRDLSVIASRVEAGGDVAMAAGRDIEIASAANESHRASQSKKIQSSNDQVRQQASVVQAGGDIYIEAGQDLTLVASQIKGAKDVALDAERDTNLLSAKDEDASFYFKKSKGSFGRKKTEQRESYDSTNIASVVEAGGDLTLNTSKAADGSLNIDGGRNVTVIGSELHAGNDLLVGATGDVAVLSGVEEHGSYSKKTKSGFLGMSKSGKSQLKTSATQVASELEAGNDVVIAAGNDIRLRASEASAGNDVELRAGLVKDTGDINLVSANDTAYSLTKEYKKKVGLSTSGGFLSISSAKEAGREAQSSTSVGSQVYADRDATLQAERDINVIGSGINAGRNVSLDAGRDVNVVAAQNSSVERDWEKKKQVGIGISGNDNGINLFIGADRAQEKNRLEQQTAAASQITAGKDLGVNAGRDINQIGSDLAASNDINLKAGHNINIDAARESKVIEHVEVQERQGLGISLNHNFGSTKDAVSNAGKGENRVSQGSSALRGVDAVSQFLTGPTADVKLGNSKQSSSQEIAEQTTRASTLDAGNDLNMTAGNDVQVKGSQFGAGRDINVKGRDITLDVAKGETREENQERQSWGGIHGGTSGGFKVGIGGSSGVANEDFSQGSSTATQLEAGRDINLQASNDLTLIGTEAKAERDINLKAGNDLNIVSAQNASNSESNRHNAGGEVGLTFGSQGVGVYVSVNMGKGDLEREADRQQEAYLYAGNSLNFNSDKDTTISGATLRGDEVVGRVGGDLHVSSAVDTGEVKGKEFDVSATATFGPGAGFSGSAGYGQTTGKTNWVGEQTSITAKDKLDIRTENHTQIDGALIASDSGNLKLDTNTLGHSDIAGVDKEHGYYLNVGGTYSAGGSSGGTTQDASQVGKGKEGEAGWSVNGWEYEKDRQQIVRATVGDGDVIVRKDSETGADSTAGLNRDVSKAYEITRDHEERTDLYVTKSSVEAVSNPKETLRTWKENAENYGRHSVDAFANLGVLRDQALSAAEHNKLVAALAWAPDLLVNAMDGLADRSFGILPGVKNNGGLLTQLPVLVAGDLRPLRVQAMLEVDSEGNLVLDEGGKPKAAGVEISRFEGFRDGEEKIFTNGIMNSLSEAIVNGLMQSGSGDGGSSFVLAYNPTHGLVGDLIESAFDKNLQGAVRSGTARNLNGLFQEGINSSSESLYIYGHSQGGLLTWIALKGLDFSKGSKPSVQINSIQLSGAPVDAVKFHEVAKEAGFKSNESRVFQINRPNEKTSLGLPKTDAVADLPYILGGNSRYSNDPAALGLGAFFSLASLMGNDSPHSNYSCVNCPSSSGGINEKIRDIVISPTVIDEGGAIRGLK